MAYACAFLGDALISPAYTLIDQQEQFLVVNKAPGVLVLGESNSLLQILKRDLSLAELHPVHRLDRDTSGIILFAKTPMANVSLCAAFAQRQVGKFYAAVIDAQPKKKQGWVIGDMAKARNGSYKLLRSHNNPAKTAFFCFSMGAGRRVVIAKIYTGKTHQVRVALRALGAPVVGDTRYGGSVADRMYLHALQLQFEFDGQGYDYVCPPDIGQLFVQPSFVETLASVGAPTSLKWSQK